MTVWQKQRIAFLWFDRRWNTYDIAEELRMKESEVEETVYQMLRVKRCQAIKYRFAGSG